MTDRPEIKLYNTLTRTKEIFEPIDDKNVRMYVCGPTVYDYAHIGNARPVIVFDVLFRLLRHVYGEDHVTYVRNITDVDDKINARALETHGEAIAAGTMSLNEAIREVTEKTASQFQKDMAALGCLPPTHEPRATDFVLPREDGRADMVSMIQTLIDKDHAYVAKGEKGREVLFRVASMKDYGALSNRKLEDQQAGARVAVESHKENAGDFVLWKESGSNEPGWDGSFSGETIHGRPGWHIECSAMSEAYLTHPDLKGPRGKTFDIHGGGLDLIFPHHENELAQSRCIHGTDVMANIWMHNGFLQVEGQKMSKSLGNFVTVHDVLHTDKVGGRRWPGEVVRLAMLMTHYREPIDFSVRRLEEAEASLDRWKRSVKEHVIDSHNPGDVKPIIIGALRPEQNRYLKSSIAKILPDDINVHLLVTMLRGMHSDIGSQDKESEKRKLAYEMLGVLVFIGVWTAETFGSSKELPPDFAMLIDERLAFILEKNWSEADRIRDELLEQGIQLKDSKDPKTGERVTTWEVKR